MSDTKEVKISSKTIFEGRVIHVHVDEIVCPNGATSTRECVDHRGGASILAISKDNKVFLVKQFRYVYQEEVLEIPAGKLEINEAPYDAAMRELEEETGFKTEKLEYLGEIYPTPGYTNEKIRIYFTDKLIPSKQNFDFDENLDLIEVDFEEFKEMVYSGKIKDAKTIAALALYLGRKQ